MTAARDSAGLGAIATAGEIDVTPALAGATLLRPTGIWLVRVGGDLCVRSHLGPPGSWSRAAQRTHRGRVPAGHFEREMMFAADSEVDPNMVDAAYRAKYGRSSYVEATTTASAAGTTPRLVPR